MMTIGWPPSIGKAAREIYGSGQQMDIIGTRDLQGAELFQMRRDPLGIEENKLPFPEPFHQREEGNFRRVADVVKHRLAEKRTADRESVKTTGKLALLPRFDGMRMSKAMEAGITFNDLAVDPGFVAVRALLHY